MIGVVHDVAPGAPPGHNEAQRSVGAVLQVVGVGRALGPCHAIAGGQQGFARVLHQHRLSLQHHQKLVLRLVPVAIRRRGTGLERFDHHAKLGEPARLAQEYLLVEPEPLMIAAFARRGALVDYRHHGLFRVRPMASSSPGSVVAYWLDAIFHLPSTLRNSVKAGEGG